MNSRFDVDFHVEPRFHERPAKPVHPDLHLAGGGMLADRLYFLHRPGVQSPDRLRWFALFVPAIMFSLYFLTLYLKNDLHWRTHVRGGGIVLAGVAGRFLSYLLVPPKMPVEV